MEVKLDDLNIEDVSAEIGRVLTIEREQYVFLRPEAYQPGTRVMAESMLMQSRDNGLKTYKSLLNTIKNNNLDYDTAVAEVRNVEIDSENEMNNEDNSILEKWNAIASNTACKYILNKIQQEPTTDK